jgi:hypothetical protein
MSVGCYKDWSSTAILVATNVINDMQKVHLVDFALLMRVYYDAGQQNINKILL